MLKKMASGENDEAITYAYRLFNTRPRSEKEFRQRLAKKGFASGVIDATASALKEKNIIDDRKFAKLWVESRMHRAPKGKILIRRELKGKGVSPEIADEVLSGNTENEVSVARNLAAKKAESLKNLPRNVARKKLFGFLARRGFDFDVIDDIIREVT